MSTTHATQDNAARGIIERACELLELGRARMDRNWDRVAELGTRNPMIRTRGDLWYSLSTDINQRGSEPHSMWMARYSVEGAAFKIATKMLTSQCKNAEFPDKIAMAEGVDAATAALREML